MVDAGGYGLTLLLAGIVAALRGSDPPPRSELRVPAPRSDPDYASTTSIWRTPLDSVLPAEPVGVTEKPFYAHLSDAGKRHPVTRGLEGSAF